MIYYRFTKTYFAFPVETNAKTPLAAVMDMM